MTPEVASAVNAANAAAALELAQLQAQVEAARGVLVRLLQDTVEAEARLGSGEAAQLLEANEQLVLAALRNQADAETATQALDEAARSAELDGLTQLPNRWLLLDRFNHAIAKSRRHSERLAVLFLDLDHFKAVNDSQGHAVGDEVLKAVGQRMLASVREEDTVSRYGGDEFVILLADIAQSADAIRVVRKIIAALAMPSPLPGQEQGWSVSIGISLYPDDGDDSEALVDLADQAMYCAKQTGRGSYAQHGESLQLRLEPELPPTTDDIELRHTQLREANEQLVMAALSAQTLQAAAEQAQQRQSAFMAVVAQELRNPMAPIRIASAMLGRSSANEPLQPRMQALIDAQWQRMSRLLDDVLDVSQAQAGELNLVWRRLDLGRLVSDAVAVAQPAISRRRQRLRLALPAEPVLLSGDAERLMQVFSNLLDNASKYTPEGGELSVQMTVAASGEVVVTTVADSGIGIAADDLAQMFEPFAQDSRALGLHGFKGAEMGLGLTVVRELIAAHGGSVRAASAGPGQGSEITVTLPLNL